MHSRGNRLQPSTSTNSCRPNIEHYKNVAAYDGNAPIRKDRGRFSRRVRGYAKAHNIPVIDCSVGERKHDIAEAYLTETTVTVIARASLGPI